MAASATLYEQRVWIIDPSNPSVVVLGGSGGSVGGGGQRLTSKVRDGSVRTYGSGRVRSIAGASTVITYTLALIHLTQAQSDQLDAWRDAGTVLLFRDTYGQKAFGSIFATDHYFEPMTVAMSALAAGHIGTYADNGPFIDVALTINEVTTPVGS